MARIDTEVEITTAGGCVEATCRVYGRWTRPTLDDPGDEPEVEILAAYNRAGYRLDMAKLDRATRDEIIECALERAQEEG